MTTQQKTVSNNPETLFLDSYRNYSLETGQDMGLIPVASLFLESNDDNCIYREDENSFYCFGLCPARDLLSVAVGSPFLDDDTLADNRNEIGVLLVLDKSSRLPVGFYAEITELINRSEVIDSDLSYISGLYYDYALSSSLDS